VGVGVTVMVGVGVGVGVAVAVSVGVGVGVAAAQLGAVMTFESRVTAPVRANARPIRVARVVIVMDTLAMMVPMNAVSVPSVAEVPTARRRCRGRRR